jgi:hypothetical protein
MVAVLVAVLLMAASMWIAIYMERRLGILPTRAMPLREPQPAARVRCRFQHGAAKSSADRPVRCTQSVLSHGVCRRCRRAAVPMQAGETTAIRVEVADLREQAELKLPEEFRDLSVRRVERADPQVRVKRLVGN